MTSWDSVQFDSFLEDEGEILMSEASVWRSTGEIEIKLSNKYIGTVSPLISSTNEGQVGDQTAEGLYGIQFNRIADTQFWNFNYIPSPTNTSIYQQLRNLNLDRCQLFVYYNTSDPNNPPYIQLFTPRVIQSEVIDENGLLILSSWEPQNDINLAITCILEQFFKSNPTIDYNNLTPYPLNENSPFNQFITVVQ
ncbi:hypothetical protein TVAG_391190 [Trichomonas vaginalis G3]|uniref:Uncharacterized protein n=1 Tax=Trichomonas vaginalis (strain ATCC PRA-98 / G3) TaxID=412133 RepID=A2DFN2_TRIV3|nr:hypothetical protein TVAGG3_0323790 [Trichomonas vaginalis G3]EAY20735.1 hypothetical protein TVAG_391190 [Trichomonas vaginalis G3]KAI5529490.1 hypothetical protein TVAGG3_0323790 [Trichomonas vaginalis G3]|eukprot:XP_001581721.1 hypothetical protein [Trichomonas vaginalis G3]